MTRLPTNPIPKLLATAAIAALTLTGCGIPDRVVHLQDAPTGDSTVGAPLREESAASIAARVLADVANASTSEERKAVMMGPALRVHNARATQQSDSDAAVSDIMVAETPDVLAVSSGNDWPRSMLVTTLDPQTEVQSLHVLLSQSPEDQFTMVASGTMLPGMSVPSLGEYARGAEFEIAIVQTPVTGAELIDEYAAGLAFPSPADVTKVSLDDPYAQSLAANTTALNKSLDDLANVTQTHTPVTDSIVTVRTQDGGMVVFGQMLRDDLVRLTDKAKELKIPDATLRRLSGKEVVTKSFSYESLENVILVAPAEGPATLIGAEEILRAAEGT